MNKKHVLMFMVLAVMVAGTALAADPNPNPVMVNMVNPIEMVADADNKLRGTNLFKATMGLATTIAVVGFIVKMYAAVGRNVMSEMRGVGVQGIGVALMLSLSSPIHGALTSTWNNTYNTSNAAFAGALGPKIAEAKGEMIHIVATVGAIASVGTTAAAAGGAIRAAEAGEALMPAAIDAGTSVAGKAVSRISASALALSGFFIMYSGIIAISAFIVMMIGYLIPLVIAFTMWGQTGPIWTAVGSGLGAIFIAAMMPILAYSAIDLTFIRSAGESQAAMDGSWIGQQLNQVNASLAPDQFTAKLVTLTKQCEAAQQENAVQPCTGDDARNAIQKAYDGVKDALGRATTAFNQAILTVLKYVGASILQVIFAAMYFIIALAIMGAMVNFIVGILGGAASYVGAVAKGGG